MYLFYFEPVIKKNPPRKKLDAWYKLDVNLRNGFKRMIKLLTKINVKFNKMIQHMSEESDGQIQINLKRSVVRLGKR